MTTNITTKEEMYDKLRRAGIIDMTLNLGCKINIQGTIDTVSWINEDFDRFACFGKSKEGLTKNLYLPVEYIKNGLVQILGHELSYGRICWWIEEKDIEVDFEGKVAFNVIKKIWSRKDLPLQQQKNEMEILTFISSLVKG